MAKKKQGTFRGIIGLIVIAVIVGFVAIGAILGIARNSGITQVTDYAVVYDNKYYMSDTGKFTFEKGDALEVKFFEDPAEFTVKVYAIKNDKGDFAFKTNGSEDVFTWNDNIAPRDVTSSFTLDITQAKDGENGKVGKIVFLSDISDVIEKEAGEKVDYTDIDYDGDFFQMDIAVGKQVIKICFKVISTEVDMIKLDTTELVFNK